jgi:hypothetical protein
LFYFQKRYVVISRELKRLDGVSRSPMYAHLSQTMQVKYGSTELDSELSFNSTRVLVGWELVVLHTTLLVISCFWFMLGVRVGV